MSQKFTVKYELPSRPPPISRNWVGAAMNHPTIQTKLTDHEKRRQDALGPPRVKHRQREPSGRALAENDSRNEKARDDKEDVDADEASGKPGAIGVEDDHAEDRERAQSVDVGSEIERRRGSRRDEVRRFEGFVQHVVLSAAGKARPFAATA